jgi:hypothetical protein
MVLYRLKTSIAGVERSADGMLVARIAAGEVLSIPDIDDVTGMVEIVYQGRNVAVHVDDLRMSAEVVESGAL